MEKLSEKKIKRRSIVVYEGIVLAIIFSLIFLISTLFWTYLQKIYIKSYFFIAVLIFLMYFALNSIRNDNRFDSLKSRSYTQYEEKLVKNLPAPVNSITLLRLYPHIRAMNAEENRKLSIEKNFYAKLRNTNIELEMLASSSL